MDTLAAGRGAELTSEEVEFVFAGGSTSAFILDISENTSMTWGGVVPVVAESPAVTDVYAEAGTPPGPMVSLQLRGVELEIFHSGWTTPVDG